MSIEEAIELVQSLVFTKTNSYLDNLQINILRGSWENQTYDQIAETYCFSTAHAKTVGAKLWDFLSQVIGTKVNKKNIQVVLQRQAREQVAADLVTDVRDLTDGWSGVGAVFGESDRLSARLAINSVVASAPEIPGGQVPLDSPFYVERPPIEARCCEAILQPGALVRIQAPRQMGKTSLMARILHQATQEEYRTITLSFQLASRNVFTNLDRFLEWFCATVGKSLGLPNQLADYWDDILGSKYSSTDYFEQYLLAQIDSPVVLGLDDTDIVFQYPEIASDFCCLLKTWYEKAKYGNDLSGIWKKLRLLVVNATEFYISVNLNPSLCNVGLSLDLPEFTQEQVHDLVRRYGLLWQTHQVEQLMFLVGGYPYLLRKTLYHIEYGDVTLEQLLAKSEAQGQVYGEHLRWHLSNLQQYPELLTALTQVASSPMPVELNRMQALKLGSMGLVHPLGDRVVVPSCDLYRQYFSC
ncbi:MAG TPA: serine/threonine protein kinase [Cyanobacteria bacterium UBA8803]|nr:serine/threonine protein kinase [Cyanobacteria bacterium UBA9273]HBL62373.1 serine/threonine protein kinase [Cyanobacteria bacterium UBA8803]